MKNEKNVLNRKEILLKIVFNTRKSASSVPSAPEPALPFVLSF